MKQSRLFLTFFCVWESSLTKEWWSGARGMSRHQKAPAGFLTWRASVQSASGFQAETVQIRVIGWYSRYHPGEKCSWSSLFADSVFANSKFTKFIRNPQINTCHTTRSFGDMCKEVKNLHCATREFPDEAEQGDILTSYFGPLTIQVSFLQPM